ncbi:hypothetical protein [Paenibacillus larvae]|uniref:hypothetical protein n=1 Tax=Paenibacillus larvae TaxID=1464 RepID=UPI001F20B536|nr:hypothetical protein [Paenibacillus larvae]
MICSFVSGILQVLISAIAVMLVGLYKFGGWHGNIDFEIFWTPVIALLKYLHIWGIVIAVLFMLAIPLIQYARAKDKKAYEEGLE